MKVEVNVLHSSPKLRWIHVIALVCVVVQFYPWFNFSFPLFLSNYGNVR